MSRTQRLNRAAVIFWVTAALFMVDGFVFHTFPIIVAALILVGAGIAATLRADR